MVPRCAQLKRDSSEGQGEFSGRSAVAWLLGDLAPPLGELSLTHAQRLGFAPQLAERSALELEGEGEQRALGGLGPRLDPLGGLAGARQRLLMIAEQGGNIGDLEVRGSFEDRGARPPALELLAMDLEGLSGGGEGLFESPDFCVQTPQVREGQGEPHQKLVRVLDHQLTQDPHGLLGGDEGGVWGLDLRAGDGQGIEGGAERGPQRRVDGGAPAEGVDGLCGHVSGLGRVAQGPRHIDDVVGEAARELDLEWVGVVLGQAPPDLDRLATCVERGRVLPQQPGPPARGLEGAGELDDRARTGAAVVQGGLSGGGQGLSLSTALPQSIGQPQSRAAEVRGRQGQIKAGLGPGDIGVEEGTVDKASRGWTRRQGQGQGQGRRSGAAGWYGRACGLASFPGRPVGPKPPSRLCARGLELEHSAADRPQVRPRLSNHGFGVGVGGKHQPATEALSNQLPALVGPQDRLHPGLGPLAAPGVEAADRLDPDHGRVCAGQDLRQHMFQVLGLVRPQHGQDAAAGLDGGAHLGLNHVGLKGRRSEHVAEPKALAPLESTHESGRSRERRGPGLGLEGHVPAASSASVAARLD